MLSFIINSFATACQEEANHAEIKEILHLAIDLQLLQQYYHGRKPLIIEESSYIHSSYIKGLKKFDLPVQFMTKNDIKKNSKRVWYRKIF